MNMSALKDLTGQKFGRLTVIERAGSAKNNAATWRCKCDCGKECVVQSYCLLTEHTQSCGCLRKETMSQLGLDNLIGQRFGRLTVIERTENKSGRTAWKCRCDCGNITTVLANNLKRGFSKSCGCLSKELCSKRGTHRMKDTKVYREWNGIKQRCLNANNPKYKDYGGRGIKVCDEWLEFQAFYDYVSKLPHFGEEGYSIDRIDNNGNYEPDNVRWADKNTQARNKRNNRIVEYNGESMTLTEAAEKSHLKLGTLWTRLKRGDTGEKLFRPVN